MDDKCIVEGHDFFVTHKGYYKADGGRNMIGPTYDHSVEYSMLACRRCGEAKEVVSADHRREIEEANDGTK